MARTKKSARSTIRHRLPMIMARSYTENQIQINENFHEYESNSSDNEESNENESINIEHNMEVQPMVSPDNSNCFNNNESNHNESISMEQNMEFQSMINSTNELINSEIDLTGAFLHCDIHDPNVNSNVNNSGNIKFNGNSYPSESSKIQMDAEECSHFGPDYKPEPEHKKSGLFWIDYFSSFNICNDLKFLYEVLAFETPFSLNGIKATHHGYLKFLPKELGKCLFNEQVTINLISMENLMSNGCSSTKNLADNSLSICYNEILLPTWYCMDKNKHLLKYESILCWPVPAVPLLPILKVVRIPPTLQPIKRCEVCGNVNLVNKSIMCYICIESHFPSENKKVEIRKEKIEYLGKLGTITIKRIYKQQTNKSYMLLNVLSEFTANETS